MKELKELAEALSETANKLAQMAVETTAPVSKYLGIEQAAEFLGMTRNQVYKLTCKRELPYYKPTGRALYFLIDDLEEFQSRGRQKSRYEEESELAAGLAKKGGKV